MTEDQQRAIDYAVGSAKREKQLGILTTANPDDQRQSTKQGRYYYLDGEPFLSVTSVLSAGVPKPALTYWSAKEVASFVAKNPDKVQVWRDTMDTDQLITQLKGVPWGLRDKAADRGKEAHHLFDQFTLGAEVATDNPYFLQFLDFLDTVQPTFIASECVVYNTEYGYAGQLDAIASMWIPGWDLPAVTLTDYKTGKDVYSEAALQLNAYARADFISLDNNERVEMPKTDRAIVVHIGPKRWRILEVPLSDEVFGKFLAAMQVSDWANGLGKTVIEKPILTGSA